MRGWIDSSGGPLLLLPVCLLDAWGGINPPEGRVVDAKFRWNPDGPATDYDRACDVGGYVGLISVGSGAGIVLGDMPMPTTFIPGPDGGTLVRWMYAESENEVLAAVRNLAPKPEETVTLEWSEGPLALFDAASPGSDVGKDVLLIDIPPGRYNVAAAVVTPDDQTSAVLVSLERCQPGSL